MAWINEYNLCVICGTAFRTKSTRLYCSNPNCLAEYISRLKVENEMCFEFLFYYCSIADLDAEDRIFCPIK